MEIEARSVLPDDGATTDSMIASEGVRLDRCPTSSAPGGNANPQNVPTEPYGRNAGGERP